MGPFFDPDKPWQLTKTWRTPYLVFAGVVGAAWLFYAVYAQRHGHDAAAHWMHFGLVLVTGAVFLPGMIGFQRRSNPVIEKTPAYVEAGSRSKRYGRIGLVLLLIGGGGVYASVELFGPATDMAYVGGALAAIPLLAGLALMSYAHMIDTELGMAGWRLGGSNLEETVRRRTSAKAILKRALLVVLFMAGLMAALFFFPGLDKINGIFIVAAGMAVALLWVFFKVRFGKKITAPPPATAPSPPPVETKDQIVGTVQAVLFVLGMVWVFATPDVIPPGRSDLHYLPIAGLLVCIALAALVRFAAWQQSRG